MEWANSNSGWSDGGIRGILTFSTIGCLVFAGLGYLSLTRALEEIPQLRSITLLRFVQNWERSPRYIDFLATIGVVAVLYGQIAQQEDWTMIGTTAFATAVLGRSSLLASRGMNTEPQQLRTTPRETVMNIRLQSPQIFDYEDEDVAINKESPTNRNSHIDPYRAAGLLTPDETIENLASRYKVDTETVAQLLETGLDALRQLPQQEFLANREALARTARPVLHLHLRRASIIESATSELATIEAELRRQFPRGSVIGLYLLNPEEVESYLDRLRSAGDSSTMSIKRILSSMYQRLSENSFDSYDLEFANIAVDPFVKRIASALNPLS